MMEVNEIRKEVFSTDHGFFTTISYGKMREIFLSAEKMETIALDSMDDLQERLAAKDGRIEELEKQVDFQHHNLQGYVSFTDQQLEDWDNALTILLDAYQNKEPTNCVEAVTRAVEIMTLTWDEVLNDSRPTTGELQARVKELENTAALVEEGIAEFKMRIWHLEKDNKHLQARINTVVVICKKADSGTGTVFSTPIREILKPDPTEGESE